MIKVFENLLSAELADEIENELLGGSHEWYLMGNVTYDDAPGVDDVQAGFNHSHIQYSQVTSKRVFRYLTIPYTVIAKLDISVSNITHGRAWLHYPSLKPGTFNSMHNDQTEPHISIIYYVNDSDGDTIFFDKEDRETIIHRQTPKKNTAVIFSGDIPHCSSTPSKWRSVFNFVLEPVDWQKEVQKLVAL